MQISNKEEVKNTMSSKTQCAREFHDAVGYKDKREQLRGKQHDVVCKTGNSKILSHHNKVTYQLHGCSIVKVDKKKRLAKLDTCGYETNTTKAHINLALRELNLSQKVNAKNYNWYLGKEKFERGMAVKY